MSFITAAPKFVQSNLLILRRTGGFGCRLGYCREGDETGDRPGVGLVLHLNLRRSNPLICPWNDLGDAADRPKRSWELGVNDHGDHTSLQRGPLFLPLSAGLLAGEVEPDELLPELVSQDLCVSPAAAAQQLRLWV